MFLPRWILPFPWYFPSPIPASWAGDVPSWVTAARSHHRQPQAEAVTWVSPRGCSALRACPQKPAWAPQDHETPGFPLRIPQGPAPMDPQEPAAPVSGTPEATPQTPVCLNVMLLQLHSWNLGIKDLQVPPTPPQSLPDHCTFPRNKKRSQPAHVRSQNPLSTGLPVGRQPRVMAQTSGFSLSDG